MNYIIESRKAFLLVSLLLSIFLNACGGEKSAAPSPVTGSGAGSTGHSGPTSTLNSLSNGGAVAADPGNTTAADLKSNPAVAAALTEMMGADGVQNFLNYLNLLEGSTTMNALGPNLSQVLASLAQLIQQSDLQAQADYTELIKMIAAEIAELRKSISTDKVKKFSKRHRGKMAGIAKRAAERRSKKSSKTGDGKD